MADKKRFKNANWELPTTPEGHIESWQGVQAAVLMDIRDELQNLNRILGCHNFLRVPSVLDEIQSNTRKRTYKKKATA